MWGGPIGFSVAVRHPEWFRAFVIGNTFGWPVRGEKTFEWFSKLLGSDFPGGLLVERLDLFTNVFVPGGIKRKKLSTAERQMLVVKLSKQRVDELVASATGARFDPRHDGRLMKEWVTVPVRHGHDWEALASEALQFVRSTPPSTRRR